MTPGRSSTTSRLAIRLSAAAAAVSDRLERDRERWILWLPVALVAGAAGYFALPVEPAAGTVLIAGVAAVLAAILAHGGPARFPALILASAVAGLALAWAHSHLTATPMLDRELRSLWVTGTVLDVDARPDGVRVVLTGPESADPPLPDRVRLKLTARSPAPEPGMRIALRAVLGPPAGRTVPGGFDLRRRMYFQGIGATGYAVSRWRTPEPPPAAEARAGWWQRLTIALERRRQQVAAAIGDQFGDPDAAAIATALLTGERGPVRPEVRDWFRASGLGHLLAISGLHLGLAAGFGFGLVRAGLALWPRAALNWPIRAMAAAAGLMVALAYLLLVGMPWSAIRAFLMTAVVLIALGIGRRPISLRLVAVAAVAILAMRPDAVTNVGFQMSFIAVIGLVALFETPAERGWAVADWIKATVLAALMGWAATGLVAAAQFQQLASYGVIANLVGVPLTGFVILPMGLTGLALSPLGLQAPAWWLMEWGLIALIAVARAVAGWPGAFPSLPYTPDWGFVAMLAGVAWLAIWRSALRALGLIGLACLPLSMALYTPPDLMVTADGRLWAGAWRDADSGTRVLVANTLSRARFARGLFERHWQTEASTRAGAAGSGAAGPLSCDRTGCILHGHGHRIALPAGADALVEDCARADLVIAMDWTAPRACAAPVLDRWDLRRMGGITVRLRADGPDIRALARPGRPWSRGR